jgi:hypothetical protein
MPNGDALNDQLEFEERINTMDLNGRSIFNAKGIYALSIKVDVLNDKFDALDKKFDECLDNGGANKKASAISGGITGGIVGVIIAVIEYLRLK